MHPKFKSYDLKYVTWLRLSYQFFMIYYPVVFLRKVQQENTLLWKLSTPRIALLPLNGVNSHPHPPPSFLPPLPFPLPPPPLSWEVPRNLQTGDRDSFSTLWPWELILLWYGMVGYSCMFNSNSQIFSDRGSLVRWDSPRTPSPLWHQRWGRWVGNELQLSKSRWWVSQIPKGQFG